MTKKLSSADDFYCAIYAAMSDTTNEHRLHLTACFFRALEGGSKIDAEKALDALLNGLEWEP